MRTTWAGTLSFGLVNVPVGLATTTVAQKGFKVIHKKCSSPVNHKRVCPIHGDIDWNDVAKGYEFEKNRYVRVEPDELAMLAPETSRNIEVQEFIPATEVNPLMVERTYFLVPAKDEIGARAYVLFLRALERNKLAAVVKWNLWGKENLGVVTVHREVMLLHLLHYAEVIASPAEIIERVAQFELTQPENKLADQIIKTLAVKTFDHSKFKNGLRARVQNLLNQKIAGRPVEIKVKKITEPKPVADLMDALKASVKAVATNGGKPKRARTKV